jgi:hypothetical protein
VFLGTIGRRWLGVNFPINCNDIDYAGLVKVMDSN